MLVNSGLIIIGLVLLVWSADKFVYGAAAIAKNLSISPLIIGLTIVAMGSSAPEMLVAASAAMADQTNTAVGNAIGSNITNILLVLGVTALLKPIAVASKTLKKELPLMLLISFICYFILIDSNLSRAESISLLIGFICFILSLIRLSLRQSKPQQLTDPMIAEMESEIPSGVSNKSALLWLVVGLVVLPLSAQLLVSSATEIAREIGISELVIGLTIIAIGTSLPELAACIAGVMKNEHDLAIGNIVGSNIFNMLAVLAIGGIITPGKIDMMAASRDMPIMLLASSALFLMAIGLRGAGRINRIEGLLLVSCFIGYQYMLFANPNFLLIYVQ